MKDIIIGEGRPIKTSQDIKKFMNSMKRKYEIIMEPGVIQKVVNDYNQSPEGKQHIVMNKAGDEWFIHFLSDEDVCDRMEIDSKQKIYE